MKKFYVLVDAALSCIKALKLIRNNISNIYKRKAKYINKKRKIISQLKKRNKVYLLTKNLKTKKLSKKLDSIKIELFCIKNIKELVSYELKLFKDIYIYSIFYVSLLKSANLNIFI